MPEPIRTSTMPSTSSAISASRTDGRDTPSWRARSRSGGSRAPGGKFAAPDQAADLVGDLAVETARFDALERHCGGPGATGAARLRQPSVAASTGQVVIPIPVPDRFVRYDYRSSFRSPAMKITALALGSAAALWGSAALRRSSMRPANIRNRPPWPRAFPTPTSRSRRPRSAAGRADFTSQDEMLAFVERTAASSPRRARAAPRSVAGGPRHSDDRLRAARRGSGRRDARRTASRRS